MNRSPTPPVRDLPDIIAAACSLTLRHLVPVLILTLPTAIVAGFMYGLFNDQVQGTVLNPVADTPNRDLQAGEGVLPLLVIAVATVFTQLALLRFAVAAVRSQPIGVGAVWLGAVRLFPAGFLLSLLLGLLLALIFTGFLTLIGAYFLVPRLLALPALADGAGGVRAALRVSRRLVRGRWWRTAAVGGAILVLAIVIPNLIFALLVGALALPAREAIVAGASFLLGTPFTVFGLVLLYFDNRLRNGEPLESAQPLERPAL